MLKLTATIDGDNPNVHDLYLTEGQLTFLSSDSVEYIAQRVKQRLSFIKGEWYLDQREGIPFFEKIFIKNPNLDYVGSIFKGVILETPGVVSVKNLSVTLDNVTRIASISFEAGSSTGEILPIDDPFLVIA